MTDHTKYMQRCLQLASQGLGTTYPNPLVGSVIVYKDRIIGEGWHQRTGEPHAEVCAVQQVKDKQQLKEATLYVNLEPCSHYGRTPPCADMIVTNQIPRVVIGMTDPNPKVQGRGIKRLQQNGCVVIQDVLKEQCLAINKRFITFQQYQRPYIILKWAQTSDGLIDGDEAKTIPISNPYVNQLVHQWRAQEQAILVGTRTALKDDPMLTVRHWSGQHPLRVVIDPNLSVNKEQKIFASPIPTLILNEKEEKKQGHLTWVKLPLRDKMPQVIAQTLYKQNIQSLIIEGGAKTLQSFIDARLWDEARIITAPKVLGRGIYAPVLQHASLQNQMCVKQDLIQVFQRQAHLP